jgi:hypothetical protein
MDGRAIIIKEPEKESPNWDVQFWHKGIGKGSELRALKIFAAATWAWIRHDEADAIIQRYLEMGFTFRVVGNDNKRVTVAFDEVVRILRTLASGEPHSFTSTKGGTECSLIFACKVPESDVRTYQSGARMIAAESERIAKGGATDPKRVLSIPATVLQTIFSVMIFSIDEGIRVSDKWEPEQAQLPSKTLRPELKLPRMNFKKTKDSAAFLKPRMALKKGT